MAAASFWTFGAIAMAELLLKLSISRGYLAVALPAGVLGLVLSRWMWRAYVARKRVHGAYSTAVLAVGGSDAVANLASELTDDPKNGYHVVGACITGYGAPRDELLIVNNREIPILGGASYALQAIRDCGADTVAIAGTGDFGVQGLRRLIWELEPMGVDLMVSPGVMDVALNRLVMRPIAGLPLLHIDKPQYQGTKGFQKRAFDTCFAFAALAGTLPILVATAIAIKLTSRGPVFYSAERIGIDGRPFSMLKFRTMVQDADKQLESLARPQRKRRSSFQDPRRSARNTSRSSTAPLQYRRAAAVHQRPPPRDERRRSTAAVEARSRSVRRRCAAAGCSSSPALPVCGKSVGDPICPGTDPFAWICRMSTTGRWWAIILIIAKTVRAVFQRKGAY